MSSKQRIYEVAKQHQFDQKELVALLQSWGLDVKNYMSTIEPEVVDRVARYIEEQRRPVVVEERSLRSNVVVRRRAPARTDAAVPPATPSTSGSSSPGKPVPTSGAVPPVARPSSRQAEPRPAPPSARPSTRTETPAPQATTRQEPPPVAAEATTVRASELKDPPPVARASTQIKPLAPPPTNPPVEPATQAEPLARQPDTVEAPAAPATQTTTEPSGVTPESPPPSPPEPVAIEALAEPAPAPAEPPQPEIKAEIKAEPSPAAPKEPAPATSVSPVAPPSTTPAAPSRPAMPPPPPAVMPPTPHTRSPSSAGSPPHRQGVTSSTAGSPRSTPVSTPPATARPKASVPPASAATPTTQTNPPPKKTGIEVWSGWQKDPPTPTARPGGPHQKRQQIDINKSTTSQRPGATGSQRPSSPSSIRPPVGGKSGQTRKFGPPSKGHPRQANTAERKEKHIKIEGRVNLQTLAAKMSLKATEVLQKLIQFGMTGVHINSSLDPDTAKIIASEFGWEIEDVEVSEAQQLIDAIGEDTHGEGSEPRPPIVTVMGHVDHGKTSLLDQIRKTKVADGEAGGITQHIGAYRVQTSKGVIAFLDTPGHEAFTAMRARGANLTDIVVLVVAADDGVMPQTREAVTHAKAAKVPIIVAINKIDKPDANPDRVKRQLMDLDLIPEELGGDVHYCLVSAKTRQGIDNLLETISLIAEAGLDLRANPNRNARAIVVESLLDKGKGPVARVIVRDGTLKVGDFVLSGSSIGKIRAMTDDMGRPIKSAGPSTPVEILGLSDVPNAGDTLNAVSDPKKAQELAEQRKQKDREASKHQGYTLDEIRKRLAAGEQQVELRVLIKADVQGSVEAIRTALQKLSGPKVSLSIVDASVGAITESDVNLAQVAKAVIVGFNVRPAGKAAQLAEREGIQIKLFSIIYQLIDEVRSAMEGLLAPIYVEKALGKAEVRVVFKLSKAGAVAGCMVTNGTIKRNAKARVRRDGSVILDSRIAGLKRFKEDVKEVAEGFECGISIENYEDIKEGDILEVYELEQVRQTL
ncbi:MAG: translation initiation factor IF-2 [Myxococcales bacterium]|nr:translation initiation factor IF-2 [Myxococcales bacterium]